MEQFINECIENTNKKISKCSREVLSISGMSGDLTRHLYNNFKEKSFYFLSFILFKI